MITNFCIGIVVFWLLISLYFCSKSVPYREGYFSFFKQKALTNNPYVVNSFQYYEWHNGWQDASALFM